MTGSLPHHVMVEIAHEVKQLGPRDHGVNRNRWGSVCARVSAARATSGLPARGTGNDNMEVWKIMKRLNRMEVAA